MSNSIKLDIGCGIRKIPGFIGLDKIKTKETDIVCNFLKESLPFEDSSVDEIFCGDVIEHLTYAEMVILINECWRILKPDRMMIIATVYGIEGWTNHPPHIRPIYPNQFEYFTDDERLRKGNESMLHMKYSDGIKASFDIKKEHDTKRKTLKFTLTAIKEYKEKS